MADLLISGQRGLLSRFSRHVIRLRRTYGLAFLRTQINLKFFDSPKNEHGRDIVAVKSEEISLATAPSWENAGELRVDSGIK